MRDQMGTEGVSTRPGHRNDVMVDLFHGWSTDTQPSGSSSTSQVALESVPVKRSASQEASLWSSQEPAPRFQTISFPKKDSSLAASLYTGFRDDEELDEKELERIRRLPPSKRPGVSHAKKTAPDHIKRPRNAYIIFRSHTVSQKLIPKEVENDHRNISRIIAHMWKSLAPEDRAHYERIAKEEKERHKQLFPNYRYQPATRRTGVHKRNVKKLENGEEECQEIADIILKAQGKEGVIVRSGPSKAVKRAREATRSAAAARHGETASTQPRTKRARVAKLKPAEAVPSTEAADKVLETVFLHPSPSCSPTSAPSSSGTEAGSSLLTPSPEPFQLASRTPSIDLGQPSPLPDGTLAISELFGRRSSSVPTMRLCSPPPSFNTSSQEDTTIDAFGNDREVVGGDAAQAEMDSSDQLAMPAPAWKGRKALPPPIANTWQFASYDDHSLPSPRSFDSFGSANKTSMGRPRTAWPSTPSSSTFRGFFHPWAVEHGNESMLISPMTASFQDLRRRSSLARAGLVAGRRPGSFGADAQSNSGGNEDGSQAALPCASVERFEFGETDRAAAVHLDSEAATSDYIESRSFAFDPALEGEGGDSAALDSDPSQQRLGAGPPSAPCSYPSARFHAESPRPSFSGSTLAAAARDWASMKRRRSRLAQPSAIHTANETVSLLSGMATTTTGADCSDKAAKYKSSLEESVERAVMLALGKDLGSDRGERNSKIVQQILSSLSTELALQQQQQQQQQHLPQPLPSSSIIESRPRSTSRASRIHYYAGNTTAADPPSRTAKPLPSPLQLITSNHEMGPTTSALHSHSYSSSQHCI